MASLALCGCAYLWFRLAGAEKLPKKPAQKYWEPHASMLIINRVDLKTWRANNCRCLGYSGQLNLKLNVKLESLGQTWSMKFKVVCLRRNSLKWTYSVVNIEAVPLRKTLWSSCKLNIWNHRKNWRMFFKLVKVPSIWKCYTDVCLPTSVLSPSWRVFRTCIHMTSLLPGWCCWLAVLG